MELNQARIEDAIVREVADKIIDEEELYSRVKNTVDARIDRLFKTSADAQIATAIEAAIARGFEHEYLRVNAFGQQEGEPTTIRRELEKMIAGYWNAIVDRQGKASSNSYGTNTTRAEWMMTQLVAADFKGEMQQHIVNLGGALKDKLRASLHETVNRLLSETFHVNSAEDQAMKTTGRASLGPKQTGKA